MDDIYINFNIFGEGKTSEQWEQEMEAADGDRETRPKVRMTINCEL